jgi:TonB family protein
MKRSLLLLSIIALFSFSGFSQDPPKTQGGQGYTVAEGPPRDQGAISGGVLNGKAVALPKPAYPSAARAIKASGAVSVQVLIGEDGNVISASAVSGHPLLRAAAVEAAKGAKFSPTRLDGQPVKVLGIIIYNFVGTASIQQVILGIGYDLANAEITREFYPGDVKGGMSASWTEELALLDKIVEGMKKYAAENPPKPEVGQTRPVEKPDAKDTDTPSVNPPPGGNRYTVVGSSSGIASPGRTAGGGFGDDTAAAIVELQAVLSRRLAENDNVLWYFRYGQSLARLGANIDDSAKAGTAIDELQVLRGSIPGGSVDTLGPQIDRLITLAEAARSDAAKKPEVIGLIGTLRNR